MIAKKMEKLVKGSSTIRAMFEEGKVMAKKYGSENVYDFSLGNPSVLPPTQIKESIEKIQNEEVVEKDEEEVLDESKEKDSNLIAKIFEKLIS